ncbi:MAG TPA: HEPN domain-containing protein [Puia sp.]|uniref:HEPN domain-containing protein n=1 Tax=Puia sp. TaxID=2045100 RepID=UPI002D019E0A|nr:HEPN domain-containing protein [Puia sp.]HVU96982.1 HEPN domain-containing protein [Puia sp.]
MNTTLEHLPEHKQKQLREITGIIVKAVDPEKVILFGSYATGRWVEHRYTEGGIVYEYISDYDILVITKSGESRKDYEVQDLIENRCVYKTPVTVITHDIDFINKMLSEGQYFFTDIEKEGILLYDAGNTPLAERKPLSTSEAKAIAQQYFEQWYGGAKEFYIDAQNAYQRSSNKNAAFYLHQATERIYNAIILVHTGYKPKTHNLDKLKRYSKRFSQELDAVFSDNTPEEKHLFDLLKRGYIDTRYKDHYEITAEELAILIERVGKLQTIAERLCLEKIDSFDRA